MKSWKTLQTEAQYVEALNEALNTYKAFPGTPEYVEREALLKLIKDYEDQWLTNSNGAFQKSR
jgi:hypothetical protein